MVERRRSWEGEPPVSPEEAEIPKTEGRHDSGRGNADTRPPSVNETPLHKTEEVTSSSPDVPAAAEPIRDIGIKDPEGLEGRMAGIIEQNNPREE